MAISPQPFNEDAMQISHDMHNLTNKRINILIELSQQIINEIHITTLNIQSQYEKPFRNRVHMTKNDGIILVYFDHCFKILIPIQN